MFKNFHFKLRYINFKLIFVVLLATFLGIIVIGSAVPGASYQNRQIMGFAGGLIIMTALMLIDYRWILKLHWIIYVVCIGLLAAVLIFGRNAGGATRWISITSSISIQPSEFAKIMMILFWAWFFGRSPDIIKTWKNFFIIAAFTVVPLLLIVKEPDLSTTILVVCLFITILFIAGFAYKKFGIILAISIPILVGAVIYIQTPNQQLLEPYQLNRVLSFINPGEYDDLRYQQDNSVLAIGSGQLTGKGLYNDSSDSVKNGDYIIEPQTDFIFAIIGEELGFVGCMVFLGLLFMIAIFCIFTGIRALDMSGRLICFGVAAIVIFQTFINIGVATELLPNTGIPLPFVSYGLSSLVAMYAGVGLVLSVGYRKKLSLEEVENEHRFNRT